MVGREKAGVVSSEMKKKIAPNDPGQLSKIIGCPLKAVSTKGTYTAI